MSSLSLASRRTTNSVAEYQGLFVGLSRAHQLKLREIHVVGDSAMIISQLRARRTPKAPHLVKFYDQCRRLVDRIHVKNWSHHLRDFNKAADKLANSAMDDCTSRQIFYLDLPGISPRWSSVLRLADGDIAQWQDAYLVSGADS
ncbi:hypothetical protein PHMEG_00013394 [Phytophthora megakarya]|uniref:RNase H type-1 domain-containing protein n=1 Tax=Phytophthora megakarya TaxID=4795 RepID=A0A225W8G5_9STRA|nr:hypothetical protein PHMEG_00013394 [Phytophthora megakarya]